MPSMCRRQLAGTVLAALAAMDLTRAEVWQQEERYNLPASVSGVGSLHSGRSSSSSRGDESDGEGSRSSEADAAGSRSSCSGGSSEEEEVEARDGPAPEMESPDPLLVTATVHAWLLALLPDGTQLPQAQTAADHLHADLLHLLVRASGMGLPCFRTLPAPDIHSLVRNPGLAANMLCTCMRVTGKPPC